MDAEINDDVGICDLLGHGAPTARAEVADVTNVMGCHMIEKGLDSGIEVFNVAYKKAFFIVFCQCN